jgi:hypothetical protein
VLAWSGLTALSPVEPGCKLDFCIFTFVFLTLHMAGHGIVRFYIIDFVCCAALLNGAHRLNLFFRLSYRLPAGRELHIQGGNRKCPLQ